MTPATATLTEIAAFWRTARRLYTIYSELNRNFEIGLPLCTDLEYPIDRSEPEVTARVSQWLEQMDGRVQAWQLRQLLQSTNLQTEENLRALVCRYLDKKDKTDIDRDKIDFLLVQYFAHCAPQGPYEQHIELANVGRVLEPVLGTVPDKFPPWAEGLDGKLETLNHCNSLEELQKSNALVDVRELKLSLAQAYLETSALIVFTRFNFLARRAFFRAMHLDLHAIRIALNELEGRGVTSIDCKEAGLTQQESLEHIRHVVHQWKTPFRAPYSGGNSFLPLVALRHILQQELERRPQKAEPSAQPVEEPVAEFTVSAPEVPPPAREDVVIPSAQEAKPEPRHEVKAAPVQELKAEPVHQVKAKPVAPVVEVKPEVPPVIPNTVAVENDKVPVEEDGYLEQCIGDITRQIMAAPPKNGASVTPITLAGCKLLIATWEADAFTRGNDDDATALQRAVAARTILHVGVERHKKHEPTDLFVALELAHVAVEEMRQQVARAKEAKNIDAAVSLAATTKRLLGLIAEGEKLCK
jgi:hypothetical protein